jgi:integrase
MSGTLPIDVQTHGIRVSRRSGTTSRRQLKNYKDMVTRLGGMGRLDIVRALRDGRLSLAEVWERYRLGDAAALPEPELFRTLSVAWRAWLKQKARLGERTRKDYEGALKRLTAREKDATIRELPQLLRKHAQASADVRPRTFNQDWAAARSFLGSIVGRYHPLYAEVSRIDRLEVTAEPINPQTPDQVRALADWFMAHRAPFRPDGETYAHHARTLWGLCLTGMRPEEFWEEAVGKKRATWALLEDRVSIHGIKNAAAVRVVPRLAIITKPGSKVAFSRALRKACVALGLPHVTPYDCRRTYATWLSHAGIPDNRQDAYMGHGARNMRELYRRPGDLAKYLAEDAAALSAYIGLVNVEQALRVVR